MTFSSLEVRTHYKIERQAIKTTAVEHIMIFFGVSHEKQTKKKMHFELEVAIV